VPHSTCRSLTVAVLYLFGRDQPDRLEIRISRRGHCQAAALYCWKISFGPLLNWQIIRI